MNTRSKPSGKTSVEIDLPAANIRAPEPKARPEGRSIQYLRLLVPKTIPSTVFGTRVLKYWVLGPSGKISSRTHKPRPEPRILQLISTAAESCSWAFLRLLLGGTLATTWTSKRAQKNGPISQNREHRQYRVHYFGHFAGPGGSTTPDPMIPTPFEDLLPIWILRTIWEFPKISGAQNGPKMIGSLVEGPQNRTPMYRNSHLQFQNPRCYLQPSSIKESTAVLWDPFSLTGSLGFYGILAKDLEATLRKLTMISRVAWKRRFPAES